MDKSLDEEKIKIKENTEEIKKVSKDFEDSLALVKKDVDRNNKDIADQESEIKEITDKQTTTENDVSKVNGKLDKLEEKKVLMHAKLQAPKTDDNKYIVFASPNKNNVNHEFLYIDEGSSFDKSNGNFTATI